MDGLREFTTFLGKVETELKDAKWLFEATEFVEDEAKRRVPVDTGELKNSIYHEVRQAEGGMIGVVETQNDHAHYVEFGTGPVGASSDHSKASPYVPLVYSGRENWHYQDKEGNWWTTSGQPAQPFMYPALKDNEEKVIEIANKGIKRALESK